MLSWVRTGLSMMGFGFIVARFGLFLRELAAAQHLPSRASIHLSVWIGTLLVFCGVIVFLVVAVNHRKTVQRILRGDPEPLPRTNLGLIVGLVLAALGIALVAYLIVLAVSG